MSRIRRSIVIVALSAAAVAGCSSGDGSDGEATTTDHAGHTTTAETTTETTGADAAAAAPDAATLQAVVEGIGDPSVPTADKADLIEDGTNREPVIEQFNGVLVNYPLTFAVLDVAAEDETTATAQVQVEGPHGGAPVPLTFIDQDGDWKLAGASFCTLAAMGQVAC